MARDLARWIAFLLACTTAVIGATLLWSASAYPQPRYCAPLAAAERTLLEQHGEARIAVGLAGQRMVRFYANPKSGTWTVLSVDARHIACVEAAGTAFQLVAPPAPGEPS